MDLREPETFSRVYADHAPEVEAVARRVLGDRTQAQDVAHDVFLRLWVTPDAFDAAARRRRHLPAHAGPQPRARRAALGPRRDPRRRAAARGAHADRAPPCPPPSPSCATSAAGWAARCASCPDPQREAVVLTYWGDLADHQVARRAGVPVGTAKSRIRLGMRRLRAEYGEREAA